MWEKNTGVFILDSRLMVSKIEAGMWTIPQQSLGVYYPILHYTSTNTSPSALLWLYCCAENNILHIISPIIISHFVMYIHVISRLHIVSFSVKLNGLSLNIVFISKQYEVQLICDYYHIRARPKEQNTVNNKYIS